MNPLPQNKTLLYNILFVALCGGLLLFLLRAPDETTPHLPVDADHQEFQVMDKKEAEKMCETCHSAENNMPLKEGHPPKNRCLLCHKRG